MSNTDDMSRLRRLALAIIAAALVTAPVASTASRGGPTVPSMLDLESQQVVCEGNEVQGNGQLTGPAATSTAHLTGTPSRIRLEVRVMLDLEEGVEVARIDRSTEEGEAEYQAAGDALYQKMLDLFEVSPQSYTPLGVDMTFVGWDLLAPLKTDGTPRTRTTETQEILDLAKAQYGGQRPEGADVVYIASDLDLMAIGTNAVAGQADCIGGVANPRDAFAVGEVGDNLVDPKDGIPIGPVNFYRDFAAKIMAHEVGHLMGGHHHYQECGTPGSVQSAVGRSELGACTLMTNAVDFQTLPFSTLNGIVVRGHAEQFAAAPAIP